MARANPLAFAAVLTDLMPGPHHEAWHRLWNGHKRSAITSHWQAGKTTHLAARCLWEVGRDPLLACWASPEVGVRAYELWRSAPPEARAAFPHLDLKRSQKRGDLLDGSGTVRIGPGARDASLMALDDPDSGAWEAVRDVLLATGARCMAVGQERGPGSVLARLPALGCTELRCPAALPSGAPAWPEAWPLERLAEQERALVGEPGEYRRRFMLEWPAEAAPDLAPQAGRFHLMQGYARDPVRFAREMFGVELWDRLPGMGDEFSSQADVARSLVNSRWVAVRSGNKVGKSWVAACVALWWACTRKDSYVILTAPVAHQVKVIWDAVHALYRKHLELVGREGGVPLLPVPALQPSTGMRWPDGRRIWGKTAEKQESFQGPSSHGTLVIVDEAIGVPEYIHQAILGIVASSGSVLALSNPLSDSGWWADAFNKPGKWSLHRMAVHQSPVYLSAQPFPGLASKDWVEDVRRHSGEQSQEWEVKVLGQFPQVGSDQVVGLRDVEAGKARWGGAEDEGPDLVMGLDVARYGDDRSAVCARRGLRVYTPAWFRAHGVDSTAQGKDGLQVVGMLVQCMRLLRRSGERVRVMIDATGGYGSSPSDIIQSMKDTGELDQHVTVVEVQFGAASADRLKYVRLRDELIFGVRVFLREHGGALYPDPELERELMATRFKLAPNGAYKCEPKEEVKARTGRSPDLADACALAVYDGLGAVGENWWAEMGRYLEDMPRPAGGL